ncbi:MAG: hypothetical protein HC945_02440 [Nitrosarchaeum sp.]|nr:hypothetical protein [Nitrosarchaeum sp.]
MSLRVWFVVFLLLTLSAVSAREEALGVVAPDAVVRESSAEIELVLEGERRECDLELSGPVKHTKVLRQVDWKGSDDIYRGTWEVFGLSNGKYVLRAVCGGLSTQASFDVDDKKPPLFLDGTPHILGSTPTTVDLEVKLSEAARADVLVATDPKASEWEVMLEGVQVDHEGRLVVGGLLGDTRYWFKVRACDANGQCDESSSYSFFTKSSLEEGALVTKESYAQEDFDAHLEHSWGRTLAGETLILEVDEEGMAITGFSARMRSNSSNIKVTLRSARELPGSGTVPDDPVYEYWLLSETNLLDAQAKVTFRAPKKWARDKDLNESDWLLLYADEEGWRELRLVRREESLHFCRVRVSPSWLWQVCTLCTTSGGAG